MNYGDILLRCFGDKSWTIEGEGYEDISWNDESPKPTEEQLAACWGEVEAEIARERVERLRRGAFIDEADPLFFGWQRGENTEREWRDKVAEIRARFPY